MFKNLPFERTNCSSQMECEVLSTRERILSSATRVFAEQGFRDATIRMICGHAGVNTALVNYHFHTKAELYKAVIGELFENVGKPMLKIPDSVEDETSWQAAIRLWVKRALDICSATKPPECWAARLMGVEACIPSEMAKEIEEQFSHPMRVCFQRLLRMAIPSNDQMEINLWHSTISAQCIVYALAKPGWAARFCPPETPREEWIQRVTEHICAGVFARLQYVGNGEGQSVDN